MNIGPYIQSFKELENEILSLTRFIHFCDSQKTVFSSKIADLITRIHAEIESIANDLYEQHSGDKRQGTKESFAWLKSQSNWRLEKKEIKVTSTFMYFNEEPFNDFFRPLDYNNNDINDIYSNFCAIKHDKGKNIKKANINFLIRSFGALYILFSYALSADPKSAIFSGRTANLPLGVFQDAGFDFESLLPSCLFIELYDLAYYMNRGKILDQIVTCKNQMKSDIVSDLTNKIANSEYNDLYHCFAFLQPYHSMGDDVFINNYRWVKWIHENIDPVATIGSRKEINYGYKRIYVPDELMTLTQAELKERGICDVSLEELRYRGSDDD